MHRGVTTLAIFGQKAVQSAIVGKVLRLHIAHAA
jgi:hypothetical protein